MFGFIISAVIFSACAAFWIVAIGVLLNVH